MKFLSLVLQWSSRKFVREFHFDANSAIMTTENSTKTAASVNTHRSYSEKLTDFLNQVYIVFLNNNMLKTLEI